MSKHLTFNDLSAGFPEFKERFQRAKHEPFFDAHLIKAIVPNSYRIRDILEATHYGQLKPLAAETDFVARIVLAPRYWDWFNERGTYTYYISKTGAISFKAVVVFSEQPKMKWANIIERWLHASMPLYRQVARTHTIKEELVQRLTPADNTDNLLVLI